MMLAVLGTSLFVLAAALAVVLLPLPPAPAYAPGKRHWDGRPAAPAFPHPARAVAALSARIHDEYYARPRATSRRPFWNNIQLMRVVSVYCIAYIHMAPVLATVSVGQQAVDVLRFGTDLFLVVAGFLTAQVLLESGKSGGAYLRARLIRLVPLYAIFTVLAFFIQNHAMENHDNSLAQLMMSLAFVSYGPFPVLYPAWTLVLIVECSVAVALFQWLSPSRGIYYAAGFLILTVALARAARVEAPALVFYSNPILVDFALGILAYRLVTSDAALRVPKAAVVAVAVPVIAASAALIVLRPFHWPQAPRLLALGLPVLLLVFSALMLERRGLYLQSSFVNFLAKCSYCIYLTHWFVNIVSEKVIVEGNAPTGLAAIMLVVVPIVVTYLAIAVYVYVETPLTRRLAARFERSAARA